jgi:FAD/FMN-containing dehydrogenase
MGKFALSLVDKHYPQLRVPFMERIAVVRAAGKFGQRVRSHARAQFENLLETALEQGLVSDAVVAENIAQAHNLWHIRESITLAQAEEGLNIKHDISIPVSRIPTSCARPMRAGRRAIDGVRFVNFGHLGDGNLHYNIQAPAEGDAKAFLRDEEEHVNTIVYDTVQRFDGSISAEHGVGELKRHKLVKHKSPVALA